MAWVFMTDPDTQNIGLYDEPTSTGDFDDPDSARNAPLNDPENHLAQLYWHILLDNMEVAFDEVVTVSHGSFTAGTAGAGETPQNAAFDYDTTMVDHDVYTHSLGYEPFVLVAIDDKMLAPGYPVQVPVSTNGSARYVTPYVTSTKVFLHEFRSRGAAGLSGIDIDYRLLIFKQQPDTEGNSPPRLIDFDEGTGILKMGDGRWSSDRRYLQVVPGGTPFGLTYGRTLDLKNGAFRLARADGTTYDPIPNTVKQGIWASGGEFETDTLVYGNAMNYDGTWTPDEIIEVQAP